VAEWLLDTGQSVTPPIRITRVGFGQSNITDAVSDSAGNHWVLREPPPGDFASTAHDIEREARILRGLETSGIPIPRVIGAGRSHSGSPFLVMERIAGIALETADQAASLGPNRRHALGMSVAETLGRSIASIHPRSPSTRPALPI
jgi:aminoglycoside phosphotransferase (APT) family kinase protein